MVAVDVSGSPCPPAPGARGVRRVRGRGHRSNDRSLPPLDGTGCAEEATVLNHDAAVLDDRDAFPLEPSREGIVANAGL